MLRVSQHDQVVPLGGGLMTKLGALEKVARVEGRQLSTGRPRPLFQRLLDQRLELGRALETHAAPQPGIRPRSACRFSVVSAWATRRPAPVRR